MRPLLWPIIICIVPNLLGLAVDAVAIQRYREGRGGIKPGVDLAGGTILIYEVDVSKFKGKEINPATGLPLDWKIEELCERLKRRIDPADLYNITIRPLGETRVEIILPTGGKLQAEAEKVRWDELVADVTRRWPPKHYRIPYDAKAEATLVAEIIGQHPETPVAAVKDFIKENLKKEIKDDKPVVDEASWQQLLAKAEKRWPPQKYVVGVGRSDDLVKLVSEQYPNEPQQAMVDVVAPAGASGAQQRRHLTTEEVDRVKELLGQVGSMEFRILANDKDDRDAIEAAINFFKVLLKKDNETEEQKRLREARQRELDELALSGKPPPPPPPRPGQKAFKTELGDYNYSWVELSREYRAEHSLANPRDSKGNLLDKQTIKKLLDGESVTDRFGVELKLDPNWAKVAKARETGQPLFYIETKEGQEYPVGWIYSREVKNLRLPERDRDKQFEYFILTRDAETPETRITGDYLSTAWATPDGKVHFQFNPAGGNLFRAFTGKNIGRLLAVELDGQIQSVAVIKDAIGDSGEIKGTFTPEQLSRYVTVLRSGALPGTLKADPVSENTIGPTLGADTIRAGTMSVGIAFVAILAFMLIYYRFAGLVACIALLSNLILTVAFMVLVQAAFTLPGLAGLVLMLGMAVDANVLIYERLREERDRGASLALAIRNGYDRALPTIIDTHLTSICTAVVLYMVGNDQLKGFGISLTVGLIISLFTSLYMTRVMFNLWLAKGWLHKLSMFRLLSRTNIDFMSIRNFFFATTVVLTILGGGLFIYRLDKGGLNIDFVGGTAYGGELVEKVNIEWLRDTLGKSDLPDLSVEQVFVTSPEYSEGTRSKLFTVRTSERDADKVQSEINRLLGGNLKKLLLGSYEILADGKSVFLEFVDPQTHTPAFISRSKVNLALTKELRKLIAALSEKSKEALAKGDNPAAEKLQAEARELELAAQQFVLDGVGADSDGRNQFMILNLLKEVPRDTLIRLLDSTKQALAEKPQPERLENFDSQLARDTQNKALGAILLSWGAILLYIWLRFGNWTFGMAAVLCLIHDLFFTLGIIACCHYLQKWAPGVASFLLIQDFKIDLSAIAALLTLVGFSVNDTIVVFDRIREVRGKNPELTPRMINDSINQTLSRTLLTSFATWLVVIVLYIWGGEGVHLFSFVMVIGVLVGTLSSIYVASPLLLIFGEGKLATAAVREQIPAAVGGNV